MKPKTNIAPSQVSPMSFDEMMWLHGFEEVPQESLPFEPDPQHSLTAGSEWSPRVPDKREQDGESAFSSAVGEMLLVHVVLGMGLLFWGLIVYGLVRMAGR